MNLLISHNTEFESVECHLMSDCGDVVETSDILNVVHADDAEAFIKWLYEHPEELRSLYRDMKDDIEEVDGNE